MLKKYKVVEEDLSSINEDSNFYLINVDGHLELYYDRIKFDGDVNFQSTAKYMCEFYLDENLYSVQYTSLGLVLDFLNTSTKYSMPGVDENSKKFMELLNELYVSIINTSIISPSESSLYKVKYFINLIKSFISNNDVSVYLVKGIVGDNIRRTLILCSKMLKTLLPNIKDSYYRKLFVESSDLYMNIATTFLDYNELNRSSSF